MAMLSGYARAAELDRMRAWFVENYRECDGGNEPDPSRSSWPWGGSFQPLDVLCDEFGGDVSDRLIEELAEQLADECSCWVPAFDAHSSHEALAQAVLSNSDAQATCNAGLDAINALLRNPTIEKSAPLCRMLYANAITVLETYLSDAFINTVMGDALLLRRFIETTEEFESRKIPFRDVLKVAETVEDEARRFMLDVVWHNLGKAQGMYLATLGVKFGKSMKTIGPAVIRRHDIVHRNGRTKSNVEIRVGESEIMDLIEAVREMCTEIEAQLKRSAIAHKV
jgi:hypothetical protein